MNPFRQKLLQAVAQLEIRSRRNIASLLAGDYRSSFRGSGMQFKEFRHYEAGDDIRHMSWPVTARTGRATVKIYEEERELNVLVMVDVSGSTLFGDRQQRKIDMYAEVSALLGLAAVKSGDPFGTLLFSQKVNAYLPPRRTQDHVRASMLRILEQPLTNAGSDLRPALAYAQRVLKVRSLILILSDFIMPAFEAELRSIARRHEVILLHGFDDAERGAGLSGIYPVWDPESGDYLLLDGNSARVRRGLAEFQTGLVNSLQELGRTCGADYLPLSVEDDYLKRLVAFFRRRGPRR
jgi:uncharacterized protein (DUF58 family)